LTERLAAGPTPVLTVIETSTLAVKQSASGEEPFGTSQRC
jgi:hypothetical protein